MRITIPDTIARHSITDLDKHCPTEEEITTRTLTIPGGPTTASLAQAYGIHDIAVAAGASTERGECRIAVIIDDSPDRRRRPGRHCRLRRGPGRTHCRYRRHDHPYGLGHRISHRPGCHRSRSPSPRRRRFRTRRTPGNHLDLGRIRSLRHCIRLLATRPRRHPSCHYPTGPPTTGRISRPADPANGSHRRLRHPRHPDPHHQTP